MNKEVKVKTRVSEVKIGDRIIDGDTYGMSYGRYINKTVEEIKVTKAGRYKLKVKMQYEDGNGILAPFQVLDYSNGAISGNTEITLIK